MLSCNIVSFFDIGPLRCGLQCPVPGYPPQSALYGHYHSSIAGTLQFLGGVYIRPPTPGWNVNLRRRAVVLVVGTVFMQTGPWPSLIEAIHMDVMHASQTR